METEFQVPPVPIDSNTVKQEDKLTQKAGWESDKKGDKPEKKRKRGGKKHTKNNKNKEQKLNGEKEEVKNISCR
jgi:hypothetical protein